MQRLTIYEYNSINLMCKDYGILNWWNLKKVAKKLYSTYLVHQYLVPGPKHETRRIQLALDSRGFDLTRECRYWRWHYHRAYRGSMRTYHTFASALRRGLLPACHDEWFRGGGRRMPLFSTLAKPGLRKINELNLCDIILVQFPFIIRR